MTTPSDMDDVRNALRLGWYLAELRGRMMLPQTTLATTTAVPYRLPLGSERTPGELEIQDEAIVVNMVAKLGVDFDRPLSYEPRNARGKCSARLTQLDKAIHFASQAKKGSAREDLARFLFAWDEKIQDVLVATSSAHAAAYVVGRGFAEVLWCPDMSRAPLGSPKDRGLVLGKARRDDLRRYMDRLSEYFDPLVVPAVLVSLDAWADVIQRGDWASDEVAMAALPRQSAVWHDLVLAERSPQSLLSNRPRNIARYRYSVLPVLGKFLPQILLGGAFLVLLAIGGFVISRGEFGKPGSAGSSTFIGLLATVLGLLGVTTAGATARLKSVSTGVIEKMRLAIDADVISTAATELPELKHATLVRFAPRLAGRQRYSALK